MNNKTIAVVIVVILVVAAGAGVFFILHDREKDNGLSLLAGVNTDGSGLYIDKNIDKSTMFDADLNPIPSGWDGKIFGTPGTATIQHVQLQQIANSMGMDFKMYVSSIAPTPKTVYYVPGISSAALALDNTTINGGSLWQPQYQKIVDDKSSRYKSLELTNNLFPGHACCVIAGYNGYLSGHQDETVRLLAAYVTAVNWVNAALAKDPTHEDHKALINIAMDAVKDFKPTFTESEIEEALKSVVYYYGENSSTPLSKLRGNIASLAGDLTNMPGVTGNNLADLGFVSDSTGTAGQKFAAKFVNDSYLADALDLMGKTPSKSKEATIKVAVINGDIHQIAIHVADKLGIFEEYGLSVNLIKAQNGPGVALAIQNGDASFGLLGAPPLTITVINGELLKA